jgi:UDP-glucose 6-dehydrogenase
VLCDQLAAAGATVLAYDPAITELPPDHAGVALAPDPLTAVHDADALVVSTPWPEFRAVAADDVLAALAAPLVIDAGGSLAGAFGERAAHEVTYLRVGAGPR